MNILNITTFDTGGAAAYAIQMNELFNQSGYTSQLVVRSASTTNRNIISVDVVPPEGSFALIAKKTKRFFYKKMNGISRKRLQTNFDYYFFQDEDDEYFSAVKILQSITFRPDVIFLYWISEFITSKTIRDLYKLTNARIFWVLNDNAPITGGCHYPWDCIGYLTDCSDCPAIINKKDFHKAFDNLIRKKNNLPKDLTFITCSEQDYQRAKSSSLCQSRNVIKLLGFVDNNKFIPGNIESAKAHFGISPRSKVVFFGASKMNEKRKGMALLIKSFINLKDYFAENQVILLYAGHQLPDLDKLPHQYLGFLNEDELILTYQAADIFVCPSVEDSGPMMINQSIMCGTPVVSFDIGIAKDIVINNLTGYCVPKENQNKFTESIKAILLLNNESYDTLSYNCRRLALEKYSYNVYIKNIQNLLEN